MTYEAVNAEWPEGADAYKPTPEEAVRGALRLYKKAMGHKWRGKVRATSGRRITWIRRNTLSVNPNERGRGWHEIVHSISHWAAIQKHGERHGFRHAWIEKELIAYAVRSGFLHGRMRPKLSKVPAPVDPLARLRDRLKRWEAKARRADRAAAKLRRQIKRIESKALAVAA